MKVSVTIDFYAIRIFIGDVPYVYIKRDEFVGFQAWIEQQGRWVIEFNTKTTSILTEQDSKEKWLEILSELNKKL